MTIKIYDDTLQGSEEWYELRRGILTGSEMSRIITPTLKIANNDHSRTHLCELMAQRITGHVEPSYISNDMLRGREDELEAAMMYHKHFHPIQNVGFVTNDEFGFTIGCSPDALVGNDGGLECKSRRQAFQIRTIIDNYATDTIPAEYQIQVQTCLLVTRRLWWDFVSYSGGLPTGPIRVLPDTKIQSAIIDAATAFEAELRDKTTAYWATIHDRKMIPTERRIEEEMVI